MSDDQRGLWDERQPTYDVPRSREMAEIIFKRMGPKRTKVFRDVALMEPVCADHVFHARHYDSINQVAPIFSWLKRHGWSHTVGKSRTALNCPCDLHMLTEKARRYLEKLDENAD